MILDVVNLSKHFGGLPAVDNCTFSVPAGQVVGVIGPNGAGKSTALELVTGFQQPSSGTVRFNGVDITGRPAHVIAGLGLIRTFQLARVWGHLTVLENLLVAASRPAREQLWRAFLTPARLRKEEERDREHARQVLYSFDLLRLKDAPAEQLSGGQKRLLEFARILMVRPSMVLLDEPSASLSPAMSARIGEGIKQLASSGMTVLLVEHDLPLVEAVCERVLVMAAGKLIADGLMSDHRTNEIVVSAYLGSAAGKKPGHRQATTSP